MLVHRIFSFSHSFQKPNSFPGSLTPFDTPGKQAFENTVVKKKLLVIVVFFRYRELSAIFIKFEIVVCKLFELDQSKILLSGNGLKQSEL